MQRIASIATCLLLTSWMAATPAADAPTAAIQDVLAAQDAGLVDVKFIPNDSRSAQVVVASRVDRPLTLRLPASFGAVPVLAQQQGQNASPAQNMGAGGGGQGNCWVAREVYGVHDARWLVFREWMEHDAPASLQSGYAMFGEDVAAWLRTRPVAKAVARPLMDLAITDRPVSAQHVAHLSVAAGDAAPTFTVFPAKSRVVRIATVCLDHGKREPNARVPYRMVALDVCSTDPRLADVLECLSRGVLTQKVAQAATWHLSSGRTWEQLASEVIEMAGGADPDVRVFSTAELLAAKQFVEAATRRHGPAPAASSESAAETASAR